MSSDLSESADVPARDSEGEGRDMPLERVLAMLHSYLQRYQRRLTDSAGAIDDLYVSLEEMRHGVAGAWSRPEVVALPAIPQRLAALSTLFELDDVEQELLLLAAAPGLDRNVARLYTFAWSDFTLKIPTAGFLVELAGIAHGARAGVAALRPDRRLVRHRLLRLHVTDHWRPEPPLIHMGVTVPRGVLAYLRGEPCLLDGFGAARLLPPEPPLHPLCLDETIAARLRTSWGRALRTGSPVLRLSGPPGSGRRTALRSIGSAQGRGLLVIDPSRIGLAATHDVIADLMRESRIARAGVLVRLDGVSDEQSAAVVEALRRARAAGPLPLAITTRKGSAAGAHALGDVEGIELPPLTANAQLDLWARLLGDVDRAERLGVRFSMPPGAIIETAAAASRHDGPIDDETYGALLRARIDHALDTVAEPVTTTLDWQDVVLPKEVQSSLEEIRSQARHRTRVFDEWGFRRKMAYGRGLACLFSGPPGTGKTMMAGIIAKDLGRAIYRVDLSRIVSKWVGETEKNLARVFDEAERAQVIIFFDEADSLFSTRTEVKGANDRFANMEVNYLLQRMEQYDGMSILTTNFERSLDEAFKRRLRFRVHFPLPDGEQRAELWQKMVPDSMARADDIQWSMLGKQFKFSGGAIKNAVLRAAFYAAEADGRLTHALLVKAADAERREMGRL